MQSSILWRRLLGVDHTIIDGVELDDQAGVLVCRVRPAKRARGRCGICWRRSPGYDAGGGRRRWRGLDLGTMRVFLEAEAPRVSCRVHGVVVASVPWARHGAGHTYEFDAQIAWLVTQCSKSAACQLMRIAWRSVGSIIERHWNDLSKEQDRFARLRRIGIDEISYRGWCGSAWCVAATTGSPNRLRRRRRTGRARSSRTCGRHPSPQRCGSEANRLDGVERSAVDHERSTGHYRGTREPPRWNGP